jgi:hypothetical protein
MKKGHKQMEKLVNNKPVPILTLVKDCIVVFLSIIAVIISIMTCSKQNQSNALSKESNEIANKANELAKETSVSSLKFDIINAEAQWGILRDSYDEIDYKILTWEKSQGLKRDGKPAKSMNSLKMQLEKLHAPNEIMRLYSIRHGKYMVLQNVSEQYKPFEERLAHIDFSMPSAPVLPRGTIGASGSFSIR